MKSVEGYVQVQGRKVWYKRVGERGIPLIVIHGGPGYPHDYLEPLEDLASERPVVFYDQLGCGHSEWSANRSLWSVDYFVSELQNIITNLDIDTYYLLGQSWGATIAASFALPQPKGLKGIVLANPYLSTPRWEKDAAKLIKQLPWRDRWALWRRDVDSHAFKEATRHYYGRFVYGMDQLPEACSRSAAKMNADIYQYMWGPTEFIVTGTLKGLDLTNQLSNIQMPTLFLCGRHDEATPEACAYFASLMPNAKLEILENSAHHTHWTDRATYMETVRAFLNSADSGAA